MSCWFLSRVVTVMWTVTRRGRKGQGACWGCAGERRERENGRRRETERKTQQACQHRQGSQAHMAIEPAQGMSVGYRDLLPSTPAP